jgi:hypothetical protein
LHLTAPSPRWLVKTAFTSWIPLAAGNLTNPPFPSNSKGVSHDARRSILAAPGAFASRRSGRLTFEPDLGRLTHSDDGTSLVHAHRLPERRNLPPDCIANYLGSRLRAA